MKPFSLDSVLKYRIQLEKIAKNRLNEAEKQCAQALLQLQQEEAIFALLVSALAGLQSQGMEVVEMIRYEERIILIKNEVKNLRTALAEKEKAVIRERETTLQKSKERKIMEKLKERQDAAWRQYLDKKEAAMLDEVAVIFHGR